MLFFIGVVLFIAFLFRVAVTLSVLLSPLVDVLGLFSALPSFLIEHVFSPGRLLGVYWAFFGHVSFFGCSSRSLSWSPLLDELCLHLFLSSNRLKYKKRPSSCRNANLELENQRFSGV